MGWRLAGGHDIHECDHPDTNGEPGDKWTCPECGVVWFWHGKSGKPSNESCWIPVLVPRFRCNHCGKVVERMSPKAWMSSYCEQTGKTTRLWKVKT